jgi:hypothetical protein
VIGDLFELLWVALLASLVVSISFSLCVLGATRALDARRGRDTAAETAWAVLGGVAGCAVIAEVAFGIGVIVAK